MAMIGIISSIYRRKCIRIAVDNAVLDFATANRPRCRKMWGEICGKASEISFYNYIIVVLLLFTILYLVNHCI